ncbi:hypothetical protein ACLOJK_024216, partial [Asimina triloba]
NEQKFGIPGEHTSQVKLEALVEDMKRITIWEDGEQESNSRDSSVEINDWMKERRKENPS